MKHSKHAKLKRPDSGSFCRNEWAFVGSKCSVINSYMEKLADLLEEYKIAIIDAEHDHQKQEKTIKLGERIFHLDPSDVYNEYDYRAIGLSFDLCFVNGNHYPATSQIVFIDEEKKDSLKRRLDQLTDISAIVKVSDVPTFDFVQSKLDEKESRVPVFDLSDVEALAGHMITALNKKKTPLHGIVLAGGDSVRMGMDKSKIDYHGQTQEVYLSKLLAKLGIPTLISKKKSEAEIDFPILEDKFIGLGPFGAICSAFMDNPNNAYLVVACDLPFVNSESLQTLISQRDSSKVATCFKMKDKDFPDPLLTIYEPRAYSRFLQFLSQGYSCPRKVLINSDVKVVELDGSNWLVNANDRSEYEEAMKQIKGEHSPS